MTEQTSTRRRGRKLAGMLAGGLALSLLPFAAPASAVPITPRTITDACPPATIPSDVFDDVDTNSTHADAIDCIAAYEITVGNSEGDFQPAGTVPRAQMATFIARLIDYVAPDALTDDFGIEDDSLFPCDVGPATGNTLNPHFVSINRLALATYDDDADPETPEQAIVEGTGDNADDEACFSPNLPVSREQMASFINRAESFLGEAITPADDYFDDDDASVHEDNIDALAEEAITAGVSDRVYNPAGNVSRDQMASFLARKLDYLFEMGAYTNTPTPNAIVTLDANTVVEGGTLSGEVSTASATDIESVEVSGTCLADDPTSLDNDADNTLGFNVAIDVGLVEDGDADGISCSLVFETTFVGGETDTDGEVGSEITVVVTDDPADDADEV